jgi:hypothetical protein
MDCFLYRFAPLLGKREPQSSSSPLDICQVARMDQEFDMTRDRLWRQAQSVREGLATVKASFLLMAADLCKAKQMVDVKTCVLPQHG